MVPFIGGHRPVDFSRDVLDSYNNSGNREINSNNNSGNTTIININSGNSVNSGNVVKNKSNSFNIGNILSGVLGLASNLVGGILGGNQGNYFDQGQNGLLDFIC